jgi:hypothetical protein
MSEYYTTDDNLMFARHSYEEWWQRYDWFAHKWVRYEEPSFLYTGDPYLIKITEKEALDGIAVRESNPNSIRRPLESN